MMDVPEIPADILEAAEAIFQTEITAGQMGGAFIKERIARAILAERERCAKIVRCNCDNPFCELDAAADRIERGERP
jgi:spore coat polysaccharide biosynthesis protein SpsF (cytidylyltransferase family)